MSSRSLQVRYMTDLAQFLAVFRKSSPVVISTRSTMRLPSGVFLFAEKCNAFARDPTKQRRQYAQQEPRVCRSPVLRLIVRLGGHEARRNSQYRRVTGAFAVKQQHKLHSL